MFVLQWEREREQNRLATEESDSSTKYMWDTPFNRAINIMQGHPEDQRPQYGHVHVAGDGATWTYYFGEDQEAKHREGSSAR